MTKTGLGVSIGTKLTLGTLAVLMTVSIVLYTELTRRERQSLLLAKETAATMVADLFAASLSAPLDFDDADAVEVELRNLQKNGEVLCAAVFDHPSVGADDEAPGGPGGEPPKTPGGAPLARLARGCDATVPITAAHVARPVFYDDRVEVARVVIGREGAEVGRARVVFSLGRENAAFAASKRRIFWLAFLLAAGTSAVLIAISRTQIVRPLRRLSDAARRVGGGDFAARVEVLATDELGDLATAFNSMSEAIGDRERRLAATTKSLRELFDHMAQAIVAFGPDGRIHGAVSNQATRLFGDKDLEGRPIHALLYGRASAQDLEAQAFEEWVATAFTVPLDGWPELAELAPKEVARDGVVLELEFRPMSAGDRLERVMLLATDVTEQRRLERTVATQEEEHERRMTAMRKLVAGGAQLFVGFIVTAQEKVASFFERFDEDVVVDRAAVDELFRHVHTMKGEARAFDLRELEAGFESLETTLAALRAHGEALSDRGLAVDAISAVRAGLFRVEKAIARAREDFVAASPIGEAALTQASVERADLDAVVELAWGRQDALAEAALKLAARPFGESIATVVERAPEWASREGKRLEVVVEGREVRVPAALRGVLPGVLTHLVRNAVAHGVEPEAARVAVGKNPVGTVWATADESGEIAVEDDGAGIDLEQIRSRARELGLDVEGVAPEELVFLPGLSTRLDADGLAGRGVGLDAVRSFLRARGFDVTYVTAKGEGTKFFIHPRS